MKFNCRPITVDFETYGLGTRPQYPPLPIGVSIQRWGERPHYYAFGHTSGNNCSWGEAREALLKAWAHPDGVLFQNAKFDVDVAETHMGMPRLDWSKYHDTLYLLFLDDPNQNRLDLKSSAERLLGMKPEERDDILEWMLKNQPVPGIKISGARDSEHFYMGYLAHAPGDLVGKYANGDVIRTQKLFKQLHASILERRMGVAYDRERRLMPHLLTIERQGVPVDLKRLRRDVVAYNKVHAQVTAWIIKELKAPADINLSSGKQLVDAMLNVGKVDKGLLGVTPKSGKARTDKKSLANAVTDKRLLAMLKYRTQLGTCLHTFMEPWLRVAEQSGGLIFTYWNQVKGNDVGARTGRMSSTPNFQNIPQVFAPIFHHEDSKAKLPKCPIGGLPALPLVRGYVVPFPGEVLIDRDYSQQEPRILAHFEGGALLEQFQANEWIDFHDNAREQIERATGRKYSRKAIKIINLGLIYGMGIGMMAAQIGMSYEETKELKELLLAMYPGLKAMYGEMKARAIRKQPIRTWGGRENYCERPRIDPETGRMQTFDYKMVNTLIQGSASDCTKEAVIRYMDHKPAAHKLLAIVHDEGLASVPAKEVVKGMHVLRHSMEGVEFDVKMLTEGKISSKNWALLRDWDKKGVRV